MCVLRACLQLVDSLETKIFLLRYCRNTLEHLRLAASTQLADWIIYIGPLTDFKVLKSAEMSVRMAIRHDAVEKRSNRWIAVADPMLRIRTRQRRGLLRGPHRLKNHGIRYRVTTSHRHRSSDVDVWDKTLPPLASKSFLCQGGCDSYSVMSSRG